MQSSYWISLLARIPVEQHSQLMLVTSAGTEIAVNMLLMTEGDCLGIRGRVSGSQDSGRLFLIPYENIDHLGFARMVSEEEFKDYFGEGGALLRPEVVARATAAPTLLMPSNPSLTTGEEGLAPVEVTPGGRPVGPSTRTPVPNRTALLESIRARGLAPRTPPGPGSNSTGS